MLDSLKAELETVTEDSTRLKLLMVLGDKTLPSYFKESYQYSKQAYVLAGELDESLRQAVCLYYLAMAISMESRWRDALDTFQLSLARLETFDTPERLATCMLKIGHCHLRMEQFGLAAEYQLKAIRIREKLGDQSGVAFAHLYLANTMKNLGQYEKSVEYAQLSLNFFEKAGESRNVIAARSSLGNAYFQSLQYDAAAEQYRKMLEFEKTINNPPLWSATYMNLGMSLNRTDRAKEAIPYLQKSYKLASSVNFLDAIVPVLINIGIAHVLLDEVALSLPYLKKGLVMADSLNLLESRENAHFQLSRAYEKIGRNKLALDHYRSYSDLRDSVHYQQAEDKAIEMEAAYDSERKKKELILRNQELELLEQDYQLTWLSLGSISLVVLLIAISLTFLWRQQRLKRQQDRLAHEAALAREKLDRVTLEKDVQFKNQQLASFALQLTQKSEQLAGLKSSIAAVKHSAAESDGMTQQLDKIGRQIDQARLLDKDWEEFKYYFEQVHTGFFKSLKLQFPALTNNDLRLCAFLLLKLSTKEIANLLGQSAKSIEIARYRLRKKLGLEKGDRLIDFLIGIE